VSSYEYDDPQEQSDADQARRDRSGTPMDLGWRGEPARGIASLIDRDLYGIESIEPRPGSPWNELVLTEKYFLRDYAASTTSRGRPLKRPHVFCSNALPQLRMSGYCRATSTCSRCPVLLGWTAPSAMRDA
jgi:hypothetical protein